MGSEVIVAIPEITELDSLAWAIGPVASGKIRMIEIEVPSKTPNKIIKSRVLRSI